MIRFRRTGNAGRKGIISDEQAMRKGRESFQTNKQCNKEKNHFRRMSNARRKRMISDEQAMQEGKE
jgi:hypothetical protein